MATLQSSAVGNGRTGRRINGHGNQAEKRVVTGFDVISAAGPAYELSIWSKNGEVLVPATTKHERNAEIDFDQLYSPIASIPPLEINYGKPHFDTMKSWLGACHNHHESCKKREAPVADENKQTNLPTRLIDISRIEEHMVTLVDANGARGKFCTLSYCWGPQPDKQIKATKTTLSDHQAGIEIDKLPQVFKEAIRGMWINNPG
jgi:hypothetical protein